MSEISFNWCCTVGNELENLQRAITSGKLGGNGTFTRQCQSWLEQRVGSRRVLLTHSCTAALEMSALLARIEPGDEVIMPSYTFVSTANAFVLRGGVPVFVDIRNDTMNLDESKIESAFTSRTRAIVPVHYAGVSCEMDAFRAIAKKRNLLLIEDAAQAVGSTYHGRPVGSEGDLCALSFHETKNVICGEGGALLINVPQFMERAEIIWEKGTNRSQFFRGQVDKYTWVDIGSSFLPSELEAAFLLAQLERSDNLSARRSAIWNCYHEGFSALESRGLVLRPFIPPHCGHNAHMYYLIMNNLKERSSLIEYLNVKGIKSVFHYIPLHSSPAGRKYGRPHGDLPVTDRISDCLLRLPLQLAMSLEDANRVVDTVFQFFSSMKR